MCVCVCVVYVYDVVPFLFFLNKNINGPIASGFMRFTFFKNFIYCTGLEFKLQVQIV